MIKSILLFLGLFILVLFGVYLFSSPQENIELNNRYSEYLTGALMRNTPTFDVTFETESFALVEPISNEDFIEGLNNQDSNKKPELLSYTRASEDENMSIQGNFGTPRIPNYDGYNVSENCEGGLIYDPCIVLGEAIKANGEMNFGSQKNYN